MELFKEFCFEAAHFLPNVPVGHKCRQMHGHSYTVNVVVEGPVDSRSGMVIDFADISAVVKPVIESLDHRLLNDIGGLRNPTSEHLAMWLWSNIKPSLPLLSAVEVYETATSGCVYRGD